MSPGASASGAYTVSMFRTAAGMAPRCAGLRLACASIRPEASKTAVE